MPSFTLASPGEDKSTIKRHLPGWPFLGMTPKLLICKRGNGEGGEGACNPAQRDFISQIRIDNVGMVKSRGLVSFSWLKLVS